ncbi:MAG: hypothetical protein ACYCZY_10695 [Lacisediminihabitans sp.]
MWLDPETEDGMVARLWQAIGAVNYDLTGKTAWSGLYFPLALLRVPKQPLATLVEQYGPDIVRLLFLDSSHPALKCVSVSRWVGKPSVDS